jgi:flagellar hook protein FlgE
MSLFGSLISSVSGLGAQSQAMSATANNIANVSTVGYKRQVIDFSALVNRVTSRFFQPGGVITAPRTEVDIQGILSPTSNVTDLGISGRGFFTIAGSANPSVGDQRLYTRDGSFRADKDGNLVNTGGYYLQAWPLDENGNLPTDASALTSLQTVNVANIEGSAQATELVALGANLPADADAGDASTTDVLVYDTLGNDQTIRMVWTATSTENVWDLTITGATVTDVELADGTASGNTMDGTPGTHKVTVYFNNDGTPRAAVSGITGASVLDTTNGTIDMDFDFSATGASNSQIISFDLGGFGPSVANTGVAAANVGTTATLTVGAGHGYEVGDTVTVSGYGAETDYNGTFVLTAVGATTVTYTTAIAPGGADTGGVVTPASNLSGDATGLTQFASDYFTSFTNQDGRAFGSFLSAAIDETGRVIAFFSNGAAGPQYQIPIVVFNNPNALSAKNGGAYGNTVGSGSAILRVAGTGDAGSIQSSALENSTVDVAEEFTKMIIIQKAYSAATRVISSTDEMLSELLRITQ